VNYFNYYFMSRIGKIPINIPDTVTVKLNKNDVSVQGPKGSLGLRLTNKLDITQTEGQVQVKAKDETDKESKALWGTYQRLISNLVTGVTEGFTRILEFKGVGWRMEVSSKGGSGKTFVMHVGYSHPIEYKIPEGIEINVEKSVITISGIDKQKVGQVAAELRSFRKPEPYKGKGIKYQEEIIKRKAGKQAKTAA
jgi:large subunit ribosomal protein L6